MGMGARVRGGGDTGGGEAGNLSETESSWKRLEAMSGTIYLDIRFEEDESSADKSKFASGRSETSMLEL